MASVTRENISNLHDKLVVNITKEDYLPTFESSLKKYGKTVSVPGFRKGNVPTGMIRKMYGQSVFIDEVIKKANQELEAYLQENKPSIFAQPLALPTEGLDFDFNNPSEFNFEFEIGLKPQFEVTPLTESKGKVKSYQIVITDDMVNEEIQTIAKRAGKVEEIATLENDSDLVYAQYLPKNAEEGLVPQEDVVTLDKMPAALKQQLEGKGEGEIIEFVPKEILSEEELKGFVKDALKKDPESEEDINAAYTLKLTKVGRLEPRVLDESFFEEVFPNQEVKDEAAFRAKIKEEIEKQAAQIGNDRLQNDIFEMLVHETPIELPVEFLKNWLKKGGEEQKTDEEVEKEYPAFEHQLRWTLISDKLMIDNEIKVTFEEVVEDVKAKVLQYFGVESAEDAPWLEDYLQKMTKDQKTIDETYRKLLFDKLFEKLAVTLEVKKEDITNEEFAKLQNVHHAH